MRMRAQDQISRRKIVASGGLLISSCADRSTEAPSPLSIGYAEDRGTLDPARMIAMDWTGASQMFETLVQRTRSGTLKPSLAESWSRVDPETWVFSLRPGIQFHDGSVCDARSAAEAISRAATLHASAQPVPFRNVSMLDARSLTIRTQKPFAPLADYLAYINFSIVKVDRRSIVGTGPYRLDRYVREDGCELSRHNKHWRGRPPSPPRLRFRCVPDPSNRLMALESGQIDAMRAVPSPELDFTSSRSGLSFFNGPGRHTHFLGFNRTSSPWREEFNDVRVRRAINLAVNREGLVKTILRGAALPAASPVPPWQAGAEPLPGIPHDLGRAEELLAEAGWRRDSESGWLRKGGRVFRINYVFAPAWLWQNTLVAELVQADLRRVGIMVELKPLDWPAARAAERRGETDLRHRGLTWAVGGTHFGLYTGFHSSLSTLSSIHYGGAPVDRLFDDWHTAGSSEDAHRACRLIQRVIEAEFPFVPLYYEREVVAAGPRASALAAFQHPHPDTYPLDFTAE